VSQARDCATGVLSSSVCDLSEFARDEIISNFEKMVSVALAAVDFVCVKNVDGKLLRIDIFIYHTLYSVLDAYCLYDTFNVTFLIIMMMIN